MSLDGLATDHAHVEQAEDVVDRFVALALHAFALLRHSGAFFFGILRQPLRVLLGALLPLAIRLFEFSRRYRAPVLGDQTAPPPLARQSRITLEHLQRLARRPAGAVEFLLATLLDIHVAGLSLVVGLEVLADLPQKAVGVGERRVLRLRRWRRQGDTHECTKRDPAHTKLDASGMMVVLRASENWKF